MINDITKLLNIEEKNYKIKDYNIINTKEKTIYEITLEENKRVCPYCESTTRIVLHGYNKIDLIHSISNVKPTILSFKRRRYLCKNCNATYFEKNPFSKKNNNITHATKILALEKLKDHTRTFTSVAKDLFVSTSTIIDIFDKTVNVKRRTFSNIVCIDEFYTGKTRKYKYACTFLDFETRKIIDIVPTRVKNYLFNYLSKIPAEERENVKYVVIDMWEPYKDTAKAFFKNSIIAVDSFHVIEHLNAAMDKVRLNVMKKWDNNKDNLLLNDIYYYMLKKFHYFFTKNYDSIYNGLIKIPKTKNQWYKNDILTYLLDIDTKLEKAYRLKEKYREFSLTASYYDCDEEFDNLIAEFENSGIDEFYEFYKLLKTWRQNIKNSFIRVNGQRLSNAVIEGANSKIKTLLKVSNGITNFERMRKRVMFSINKDIPYKL